MVFDPVSFGENITRISPYVKKKNIDLDHISVEKCVTTVNINTVTSLDVNTQNIADLTGIEDFINLQILLCFFKHPTVHTHEMTGCVDSISIALMLYVKHFPGY